MLVDLWVCGCWLAVHELDEVRHEQRWDGSAGGRHHDVYDMNVIWLVCGMRHRASFLFIFLSVRPFSFVYMVVGWAGRVKAVGMGRAGDRQAGQGSRDG